MSNPHRAPYLIVTANDEFTLQSRVNSFIMDGYIPIGGIAIESPILWCQALFKATRKGGEE